MRSHDRSLADAAPPEPTQQCPFEWGFINIWADRSPLSEQPGRLPSASVSRPRHVPRSLPRRPHHWTPLCSILSNLVSLKFATHASAPLAPIHAGFVPTASGPASTRFVTASIRRTVEGCFGSGR
jgi:hypothetical protein